jgi:EKC/KEOPS complex subunit CGI121/TPRKB
VEGESVPIGEDGEEIGAFCDVEKVKKAYKLDGVGGGGKKEAVNGTSGAIGDRKELEGVILGMMTIKGS